MTASKVINFKHIASVLKSFIEATIMVSRKKSVTISLVQPILAALEKKDLLPKDTHPDLVQEMKTAIQGKLEHTTERIT